MTWCQPLAEGAVADLVVVLDAEDEAPRAGSSVRRAARLAGGRTYWPW